MRPQSQDLIGPSYQPNGDRAQLTQPSQAPPSAATRPTSANPNQPENPFLCNICKRSYSRIDHLARHYRSHTHEKPFSCHLCDKEFGRADLLKRHVAAHDDEKTKKKKQKTAPSNANSRVSQACTACAEAKLKCEQKKPCSRCEQRQIVCQYIPNKRKAAPESPSASENENIRAYRLPHDNLSSSQILEDLQTHSQTRDLVRTDPDRHVIFDSLPMEAQLSIPHVSSGEGFETTPLETDGLMNFENSSFADFLRDIMMPLSPSAEKGHPDAELGDQSFTTRDVLNFGVDIPWELPTFESSFPLQIMDEDPQLSHYSRMEGNAVRNPASGTRTPEIRNSINLGAQAFKESVWQWVPAQNDHGYAEQLNLSLPPGDVDLSNTRLAFDVETMQPRVSQTSRDRILAMVLSTCQQSIFAGVVSSFPSVDLLTRLLHKFMDFHSRLADSWIHAPTIQREQSRPELLAIMVASGAVLSGVQVIRKLGFALQEVVRLAVPKLFENDNRTTRDLQILQAYALQLDIGLWSGDRRKMEMAESHAQPLVTMTRRAGHFRRRKQTTNAPTHEDDMETLEAKWHSWAEMESMKRLVFHLLIRDAQTSISLLIPPLISYAEVSLDMPAAKELWVAQTAVAWKDAYLELAPLQEERLPSLPRCIHDTAPLSRLQKSIDIKLSTLIVLYGISTLIWEYRQLNAVVKLHPASTHWNSGLITTSLHQELCQLLHHFHMDASDWGDGMSVSATLAYERSLLNLHVSFEDLQSFAGKEGEYEARRVYPLLQQWTESRESRQAIWHAGQVIRAAKKYQPQTLRDSSAIALYHASLALWAYAVVSNSSRSKHAGTSATPTSSTNDTAASGFSESEIIWLDGEDGPRLQRFLKLNRGIPAIRRWTDDLEPRHNDDHATLSEPGVVMEIAISILRKKSTGEDKSYPPLVENLCLLMRSLGNAARGIRRF